MASPYPALNGNGVAPSTPGVSNGSGAGPSNGHRSVYSSPPSSPMENHASIPYHVKSPEVPQAASHDQSLVQHLYHAGFCLGNYSDITLQVPGRQYALHAIILSRSPYLAHMMSTSPSSKTIVIPLDQEPHITLESFNIALGYLYSTSSIDALHPGNARAVLAAACFLGGMEDLCTFAYQICQQSISVETIMEWLDFVETIPAAEEAVLTEPVSVFGPYAKKLREDVFNYIAISLPTLLGAFDLASGHPEPSGHEALLHIYSRIPFDFFKRAVESTQFPLHGNQARFRFAKAVIALRKQKGVTKDAEETVVLAFDGQTDSGNAVHITRKMKKKPLWKVTK